MLPMMTGALIGAGGEGTVYEDAQDDTMVIKVLHSQFATPDRAAKLRAMCDNPPPNLQWLGWPVTVEAHASSIRFRMPKAPRGAATAYRFISANERRRLPGICQGYEYRSSVGVNIAEALRGLHASHVRIGDVNPSNILVDGNRAVTLIDCDSFQIPGPPGHQPYPCVVGSPEYTAPEIDDFRRQFRSQDSDNFALAVLLYQLLGNGSHPYQGIDASPQDAVSNIRERIKQHRFAHQSAGGRWQPTAGQNSGWQAMPEPVRDAFRQAFSPGASQIGRPTADAWVTILTDNPASLPASVRPSAGARGNAARTPAAWPAGNQLPTAPAGSPSRQPVRNPPPGAPGAGTAPPARQLARPLPAAHRPAPAGPPGQLSQLFRSPISLRLMSSVVRRFLREAAGNWRVSLPAAAVGLLVALVLLETARDITSDTLPPSAPATAVVTAGPTPQPVIAPPVPPTNTATPAADATEPGSDLPAVAPPVPVPDSITQTPVPTATPSPTDTPVPTAAVASIPPPAPATVIEDTATPYPAPEPTLGATPGATAIPTPLPSPIVIAPNISVQPGSVKPGASISIYGQALPPAVPVSRVTIGGLDVIPSPSPVTDGRGILYFNIITPGIAGGQHAIEVQVGDEVYRTVFSVVNPPTPTPTVTSTPAPTRVPLKLTQARHGDAHYTVNEPVHWPGGRVTFLAKPHSGTPGDWVQYNAVPAARRYDIKPLKDAGVDLVGTYFKERYSDEQLCGRRGYVVIRETALVLDFREVGIALHMDVCEADLLLEAESGFTNEAISNEIVRSLRQQN